MSHQDQQDDRPPQEHDETPAVDDASSAEVDAAAEAPEGDGTPGTADRVADGDPGEPEREAGASSPADSSADAGADEQTADKSDEASAPADPLDVSTPEATAEEVLERVMGDAEEPVEAAVNDQLVAILEAIVFASPEPITPKAIFKLLDAEPRAEVEAALAELERRYTERGGGLQIVEVAGGYQIVTRPELHEWVRRMFHERTTQKLSVQALETLAVIAYKQPITAAEITEIRGVNTSGVIGTLLERSLVKISGRKQVVGRPFLYSTTREFLDRFGLKDLNDLPKVEDMAHALGFEPPAGLATDVPTPALPLDEPATAEDEAVLTGHGEEDDT